MAPVISLELVRRRAEHNEGLIHTLEEISLHQEEIERINDVLGKNCRHLKILYLQNNIINKMENLHHLKELEYLNLALNNITIIEGLGSCEMLNKLDLTVNFIDLDKLQESIEHLASCPNLKDLYMMGNPAQANWEGFAAYVTGILSQLERLDGREITRSMRITAQQQLPALKSELMAHAKEVRQAKADKAHAAAQAKEADPCRSSCQDNLPSRPTLTEAEYQAQKLEQTAEETTPHTPEVRTQIYRELAEQKREKDERQRENLPKERDFEQEHKAATEKARQRELEGVVRQCNEGKLDFFFDEQSFHGHLLLDIAVPRYLDSSLIDVDVHPHYISVVIKGKVLRLQLPVEVLAGSSKAQRSKTTGHLVIYMPKVNSRDTVGIARPIQRGRHQTTDNRTQPNTSKKTGKTLVSLADMMMVAAQQEVSAEKYVSEDRAPRCDFEMVD